MLGRQRLFVSCNVASPLITSYVTGTGRNSDVDSPPPGWNSVLATSPAGRTFLSVRDGIRQLPYENHVVSERIADTNISPLAVFLCKTSYQSEILY